MKTIPLTKGYEALVDDEDFESLSKYRWHLHYPGKRDIFYAQRHDNGRTIYMHREIMKTPVGKQVDHVDRNGLNNQKHNLRNCTVSQNVQCGRTRCDNKVGVRGLHFNPRTQSYQVSISGKHVGYFKSKEAAIVARKLAEIAVFGEFAPA